MLSLLVAAAWLGAVAPAAAVAGPCYQHPVPAAVSRGFEAPACPWCSGHRGLQYATRAGDPVRAASAGRVSFAGLVAGARWVTIEHPDGLRTSYGGLASIAVRRGQAVDGVTVVGTAGGALHVGLRRGDTYLDPAALFTWPVRLVPRLVPLTGPVPARPAGAGPGCVR
jgi:murein DD-endopeptidase MepM/ murein hydrolase activator NlpD